jgi:trehalose 6-phosphate synthase
MNGEYANIGHPAVHYLHQSLPREELAAFFVAADVMLVTPLRDGMNLVAKEYVAAQDPDDPGVLVLSQFAGASEQMERALIVNPFDRAQVAEAIAAGLAMPRAERAARWRDLMDGLRTSDVNAWREAFVAALTAG